MRSKCRKYKLEHDLKLIIIDYLQLMSGSGRSTDSRQQEISDISRSLKALARELNVPVLALSQLSRAVEQRPDHRPMLSDPVSYTHLVVADNNIMVCISKLRAKLDEDPAAYIRTIRGLGYRLEK